MTSSSALIRQRGIAVILVMGMILAGVAVWAPGAVAHPGHDKTYGEDDPDGVGVLVNSPDDRADFLPAVQWGDTGDLADQTADLVYAGTGCTPAHYAAVASELDGNIALVDSRVGEEAWDQCPAATFFQKVRGAEAAGAIGFVQIPGENQDPTPNATAVDAGIPALEVWRDQDALDLRAAVIDGETVNVSLVDLYEPIELEPLSDVVCQDGQAGPFECDGIDLLAFVPQEDFDGDGISDLWGWTDPENGDEYIIIGKTNGVGFFDVTEPTAPVYLGELPNDAVDQAIWHDIKVYADHAFIVSESMPHGMKVFDLTRLRDVDEPQEWDADALYPLVVSAHNIELNVETGYAYIVGGNTSFVPDQCLSGLHIVDVSDPTSPSFAGCYLEEGGPTPLVRAVGEPASSLSPAAYVHDAQCVVYDGPDERYTGQEICFNSAENKVVIADVTDKLSPVTLGVNDDYPNIGYTHQGWLTEDHRFLIVNDELDEVEYDEITNTRTLIFDVSDLEDPVLHAEHFHETRAITHNNYVVGDLVYQSNYTAGLRVLDTRPLSDEAPRLEEIGFFDTFPSHGDPIFAGTWSNYPFFESGTIAVSGIDEGLFLLRLQDDALDDGTAEVEISCEDCPLRLRADEAGTVKLTVRNTGDVDDTYEVSVDGTPEDWTATADPEEISVDAGEEETVTLTVEVPTETRPGRRNITVTVTSTADPDVAASEDVGVVIRGGPPSHAGPPGGGPPGQSGDTPRSSQGSASGPTATAGSHAGAAPLSPLETAATLLLVLTGLAVTTIGPRRRTRQR